MSQQPVLYQWNEEIRKRMQHLSNPQSKALAAFSFGIAKEEGCGLIAGDKIDRAESRRAMSRRIIGSLIEYKAVKEAAGGGASRCSGGGLTCSISAWSERGGSCAPSFPSGLGLTAKPGKSNHPRKPVAGDEI